MKLESRGNEARRDELGVVEVFQVGELNPPYPVLRYGQSFVKFTVVACRYNRIWPGHDSDVLFAVEGHGWRGEMYGVLHMWGFYTEQECYDFLTGRGPKEYHSHDIQGKPISDVRERLGLPDAYVMRYATEVVS